MSSIRRRLLLPLSAGLLLVFAAGGAITSLVVRDNLLRALDGSLMDKARTIASHLEIEIVPEHAHAVTKLGASVLGGPGGGAGTDAAAREQLLQLAKKAFRVRLALRPQGFPEFARTERATYYQVWLGDGTTLATSPSLGGDVLPAPADEEGDGTRHADVRLAGGVEGRAAVLVVDDIPFPTAAWTDAWKRLRGGRGPAWMRARVVVARDLEDLSASMNALRLGLILAGLALVLGSAALVVLVTRRSLRPLRLLREQVARLGADSLHERVALSDPADDLQPVVDGLNASLDRIEQAFQRERRTAGHIAHELRTPIAELRTITDMARRWPDDEDLRARCVAQGHDIALHMSRVVSALLRVARADSGELQLERVEIDVPARVEDAWARMESAAAERRQSLAWDERDAGRVLGDPELVDAILANLLQNAVEHAPAGSTVRAALTAGPAGAVLTLSNPAPDLSPEDVARAAEPFWRKDDARTHSSQGGLGLSLVAELARAASIGFGVELVDGTFRARLAFPG